MVVDKRGWKYRLLYSEGLSGKFELNVSHLTTVEPGYTAMFRTWETLAACRGWRYIKVVKRIKNEWVKEVGTSQKLALYRHRRYIKVSLYILFFMSKL